MDIEKIEALMALQLVPKVGPVLAKQLIAYCGSAEEVFKQKKHQLEKIPGIGAKLADNILKFKGDVRIENELKFIEKHKIQVLYLYGKNYPKRLKEAPDAPLLLFHKGNTDFDSARVLGVVGTRKATDYGKKLTEELIAGLAPYNTVIISGLAYGIDVYAHKAALQNGLQTVGVLGHGLDSIYPPEHRATAAKMTEQGGLLTEFVSGTLAEKGNFPARNRIVAGLIDGLVVVETAKTGGALITADISNSYDRDVFAFPGRTNDVVSQGCNHLIKTNRAHLIEGAEDVVYFMGWELKGNQLTKRTRNYTDLKPDEEKVVRILKEKEKLDIDSLVLQTGIKISALSMLLLEMEFKGYLHALPGKYFRLI